MEADIVIVGGGLAGLCLAEILEQAGVDWALLEARDRFGGRVLSETHSGSCFDLGPAWYWPGQPRIASLVARLGLTGFDQHFEGDLCYEDDVGNVHRGQGFASMQGSLRVEGGLGKVIDVLVAQLPAQRLHLGHQVDHLIAEKGNIRLGLQDQSEWLAGSVAFAMPPRLVARSIDFSPTLSAQALRDLANVPTWMAGQAKAVAVYDTPFWRDAGLSGDAMSRFGPLAEIHDASPADLSAGALFGFVGVPPAARADKQSLKDAISAQLVRLFGPQAAQHTGLLMKDWAFDTFTATDDDLRPARGHPAYGLPSSLRDVWCGHVHFAGTEVAPQFGGFLEGALEAAEIAAAKLLGASASPFRDMAPKRIGKRR